MAPTAARRAKPVQRSNFQGLQGNPDACRPRRGSACDVIADRTGGNASPVLAGQTQPTAAMSPRIGGCREYTPALSFPPLSFGKKAVPRPGRPRREAGPPSPHADHFVESPRGPHWVRRVVAPHGWGARRAGIREPLIRPSARTGAPSPQRGEGSGRAMRAPRGHTRFRAKKRAARDTGGACVYRSSRKYAKPRLAGGCLSRLLRREVKISTTTVTT